MDASKYLKITGNEKHGITKIQAVRTTMAEDLRTLADQVENGSRNVMSIQTQERADSSGNTESQLFLVTQVLGAKP